MHQTWTVLIDIGALSGLALTAIVLGERLRTSIAARLAYRRYRASLKAQDAERQLLQEAAGRRR
jgi:hypothetical protein